MDKSKKTIGIAGGGQLGKMLTEAAHKLGFKVIILDPTPFSPAGRIADEQIVGDFKHRKMILKLAKKSDFITFETESTNAEALKNLKRVGISIHPDPETLEIIKDKLKQKIFLKLNGIPVAEFMPIDFEESLSEIRKSFGYPYLIKTRFNAYDGRGNFVVKEKKDANKALKKFKGELIYAERFVPFKKELAVVSARDVFGKIVSYPVVETIHKNNICHIVRSPAPVSPKIRKEAEKLAGKVLKSIKGVGVFGIEMFLTKNNKVLINEIAPRVHNSGHHTLEAFNSSQFEQHIRAVTGMPILKLKPSSQTAVMINILGTRNGKASPKGIQKAESIKGAKVHIYGKMETRKERKMGHITVTGPGLKSAEQKAKLARKIINI